MAPTPDNPPVQHEAQPRFGFVRRNIRYIAATAAGTLAIGIGAGGQYYAGEPLLGPKLAVEFFTDDSCIEPYPETIEALERRLQQPTDPQQIQVDKLVDRIIKMEEGPEQDVAIEEWYERDFRFRQGVADEHGLTLIQPRPYLDSAEEAESTDELLDILNSYTGHHGFSVELHESKDLRDIGYHMEEGELTIDTEKFRQGVQSMIRSLSYLPVEVAQFADMDTLRIVPSIGSFNQAVTGMNDGAAEINTITGLMYYELAQFYNGDYNVIMHEIGHRLDYKLCGLWGALRDKHFTSLNAFGFQYGNPSNEAISDSVADIYQQNDVIEDKAVLYEGILGGLNPRYYKNSGEYVRAKYMYLLGRLETAIPGVGKYLIDTTNRSDS